VGWAKRQQNNCQHLAATVILGARRAGRIEKLAKELTKTAMSVIGYGDESFSVAIEDVDPKDWAEKV